jgi:C1A family cysteine protease
MERKSIRHSNMRYTKTNREEVIKQVDIIEKELNEGVTNSTVYKNIQYLQMLNKKNDLGKELTGDDKKDDNIDGFVATTRPTSEKKDSVILSEATLLEKIFYYSTTLSGLSRNNFEYDVLQYVDLKEEFGIVRVRDQKIKSCTSCAVAALIEYIGLINGYNLDIDEVDMFHRSKVSDEGSRNIRVFHMTAIEGVLDKGLDISEDDLNYNQKRRMVRIYKPVRLDNSVETIRSVLAAGLPVVASINLYTNAALPLTISTGDLDMPYGEHKGGHTILITGYDNDNRRFRFLNSWGKNFGKDSGQEGFGTFSYDYRVRDCWTANSIMLGQNVIEVTEHTMTLRLLIVNNAVISYEKRSKLLFCELCEDIFDNVPVIYQRVNSPIVVTKVFKSLVDDEKVASLIATKANKYVTDAGVTSAEKAKNELFNYLNEDDMNMSINIRDRIKRRNKFQGTTKYREKEFELPYWLKSYLNKNTQINL